MALDLEEIVRDLQKQSTAYPPVETWQPKFVAPFDLRIDSEMNWYHEGGLFQRQSLVKLLSSILRKDDDGYCLVTPAEKLLISVADVPFKIIAFVEQGGCLYLISNAEDKIALNAQTHWQLRDYHGAQVPYVTVRHDLWARLDRTVFYQLIEQSRQENGELLIDSAGVSFSLGQCD